MRWLWLILAISLHIVGGLLRAPDSLDRAIDIGDLGGVVRAIDNAVFVRGYADPLLRLVSCVKLLIGCSMGSIFTKITGDIITSPADAIFLHIRRGDYVPLTHLFGGVGV